MTMIEHRASAKARNSPGREHGLLQHPHVITVDNNVSLYFQKPSSSANGGEPLSGVPVKHYAGESSL